MTDSPHLTPRSANDADGKQDFVATVQDYLRHHDLDGWLIYDFSGRNPMTTRILGDAASFLSRRWLYFIPARMTPTYLFHAIEANISPPYPGEITRYVGWQDFRQSVAQLLKGCSRIALEYSPNGDLPAISAVDGGTIDFLRSLDIILECSADLIQYCTCRLTEEQISSHRAAAEDLYRIREQVYESVRSDYCLGYLPTEYQVQQRILSLYADCGLVSEFPPIVAVGSNAGNPHYQPEPDHSANLAPGQVLMLDMWAKKKGKNTVYADITWMAWLGRDIPPRVNDVFYIVVGARDAVLDLIHPRGKNGQPVHGFEADDAARQYIAERGFAKYFTHRTGHNLGDEVHGSGANLDNLETHENRMLIPATAFTIEPGIYLDSFGIRSEIDVYHDPVHGFVVTTPPQQEIVIVDGGDLT